MHEALSAQSGGGLDTCVVCDLEEHVHGCLCYVETGCAVWQDSVLQEPISMHQRQLKSYALVSGVFIVHACVFCCQHNMNMKRMFTGNCSQLF